MTTEKEYSSAMVFLLDRGPQTVKPLLVCPITRIELNEFGNDGIITVRVFIVVEGKWVEENRSVK